MSFDSAERSLAGGRPIRLYQFARGLLRWAYASCDRDVDHLNQSFKALRGGIADNGIQQSGDSQQDQFVVTAPGDLEVAQRYRAAAPSAPVQLTVFARHDGVDDYLVIWVGEVRSVKWTQPDRCEIACAPLSERMEMQGLRLGWERNCPHALYSLACGVDRNGYRVDSSVQTMDGAGLDNGSLAAYPADYFTGGYVEWPIGSGEYERRGIERHAGSTLTLLGGTAGLALAQAIRVYPGCAQTTAACLAFANLPNYGGIPHLAGKSPFDGNQYF
ncbi:phage conserved hypothetical protein BR0599 [Azotobacter beijerinckii]|uniref:Bacteriophage phiJL001 Gp84 C-terminal domain-containing protein n=1 Tax=Azotobacter beijerinckii TaxID=170623 RepID=A0A1H6ZKF9_9GAMM|nr:phage BR0599 family protein [Azotobacter beijerinckii]SEJ50182.1 phage conserved hypothetical protein BR0599 [Azotobacter beijerinckii]